MHSASAKPASPWRCAVLDDEPLAGELLADYIEQTDGLVLAATHTDPISALQALRADPPDLLFLDVQMPGLNGLDVAKLLGERCRVILTTAYEQYALEGFNLRVIDYLLKPISYARFLQAVEQARRTGLEPNAPSAVAATPEPYLFIKNGHRTERVDLDAIRYLKSTGDYVELHLTSGKRLLTQENLTALIDRLPSNQFCRIHRSHAVALAHIEYVERGRVVLGDVRLPISDGYAKAFQARIGK